jgi:hypothetical protein
LDLHFKFSCSELSIWLTLVPESTIEKLRGPSVHADVWHVERQRPRRGAGRTMKAPHYASISAIGNCVTVVTSRTSVGRAPARLGIDSGNDLGRDSSWAIAG